MRRFNCFRARCRGAARGRAGSRSTNASSIQNLRVKPGMTCAGRWLRLKWVAASLRFECLSIAGVAANPSGADKQVQFNDGGVFGSTTGFLWDKATQELSFGASPSEAALRMPSLALHAGAGRLPVV